MLDVLPDDHPAARAPAAVRVLDRHFPVNRQHDLNRMVRMGWNHAPIALADRKKSTVPQVPPGRGWWRRSRFIQGHQSPRSRTSPIPFNTSHLPARYLETSRTEHRDGLEG